jgi:hypothetical protein
VLRKCVNKIRYNRVIMVDESFPSSDGRIQRIDWPEAPAVFTLKDGGNEKLCERIANTFNTTLSKYGLKFAISCEQTGDRQANLKVSLCPVAEGSTAPLAPFCERQCDIGESTDIRSIIDEDFRAQVTEYITRC